MTLFSFGSFCDSWRSRFLGGRKVWHSHYRGYLIGWRSNFTTISFFYQLKQVQQALHLLKLVFSRGGRVWAFNLSFGTDYAMWGNFYQSWNPGQFSNNWVSVEKNRYLRQFRSSLTGELESYTTTNRILFTRSARTRSSVQIRQDFFDEMDTENLVAYKSSYIKKRKVTSFLLEQYRLRAKENLLILNVNKPKLKKRRRSFVNKISVPLIQKLTQTKCKFLLKKWITTISQQGFLSLVSFYLLNLLFFKKIKTNFNSLFYTFFFRFIYGNQKNDKSSIFFSFYEDLFNLSKSNILIFYILTKTYDDMQNNLDLIDPQENNFESLDHFFYIYQNHHRYLKDYLSSNDYVLKDKPSQVVSTRLARVTKVNYQTYQQHQTFYPLYLKLFQKSSFFKLPFKEIENPKAQSFKILKLVLDGKKSYNLSCSVLAQPPLALLTDINNWGYNSIKRATFASGINGLSINYRKYQKNKWFNRSFFYLSSRRQKSLLKQTLLARQTFFLHFNRDQLEETIYGDRGIESWPLFPSVVVAGALKNKLYSLAAEVENCQLPFIHLYTTRTTPNVNAYGILWNEKRASCSVWFDLIETIWKYTQFGGLLSLFSRRLL